MNGRSCYATILVIVFMISNTPPLEQGRQRYIYVTISCLYIHYVTNHKNVSSCWVKFIVSMSASLGIVPVLRVTVIFLVEMFKTPRSLLRNCKWTLSTSVLSRMEKLYPLYGFQTSLPHKRIGKMELSKHFSAILTSNLWNLYLLFRENMALGALLCRSSEHGLKEQNAF